MKAIILSAGFGTRLAPLTDNLPKALITHKNRPMINYQIDLLKGSGVNEIVVNAHHHFQKIMDYFSENDFGIKINVIVEDEILGTGGGIMNASYYFQNENFFIAVNADLETGIDLSDMIKYHQLHMPFATLAVQKRNSKKLLEFDREMNLMGRENYLSEKRYLYAFNGMHIISNEIFRKNYEVKFMNILDIYFNEINNRTGFVKGFNVGESIFNDLGKLENLIA